MPSRAMGVFFAFTGAALLTIVIWGATLAPDLPGTDLKNRWLLTSSILTIIALAITAGGVVLVLKRWWGLLPIAAAMALWAIYPWVMQLNYDVLYGFEAPNAIETALLALASLIILIAFVRKSKRRVDA
jgi:hypothetical protein